MTLPNAVGKFPLYLKIPLGNHYSFNIPGIEVYSVAIARPAD